MKKLLAITAVIESGTGLLLLAMPSQLVTLLLGAPLDTPASLVVARVAGIALLAIGAACWLARADHDERAARGLVAALLVYNAGAAMLFAYAGLVPGLSGMGLWPVVVVHVAMAGWCVACLPGRRA